MLTDAGLRGVKPSDKAQKLSDGGGLYLHVAPNGGRYWRYNYRFDGKQKTLSLGVYPDVSLAKARERHKEARQRLADDIDPSAAKQVSVTTFESVARDLHAHWKTGRSAGFAHYVLKRLEADIFPELGALPVSAISTSAFREAVQKIEQRGAAEIARRALQNCGQIMRYAVSHDLAPHNPVTDIKPRDVLKGRKRRNLPRVSEKELPALLRAVDGYVGTERVWSTALAAILPPEHRLTRLREVGLQGLLRERLVLCHPDLAIALSQVPEAHDWAADPSRCLPVANLPTLLEMVAAGFGVGLTLGPQVETLRRIDITIRPFAAGDPTVTTYALRQPGVPSELVTSFIDRAHALAG